MFFVAECNLSSDGTSSWLSLERTEKWKTWIDDRAYHSFIQAIAIDSWWEGKRLSKLSQSPKKSATCFCWRISLRFFHFHDLGFFTTILPKNFNPFLGNLVSDFQELYSSISFYSRRGGKIGLRRNWSRRKSKNKKSELFKGS